MTRAGLYRRVYPIAHCAYSACPLSFSFVLALMGIFR